MFERFTDKARHVVVLAQEEAREMQHNYIGTEHLLLGLLGEPRGMAARALGTTGLTLEGARDEVASRIGRGKKPVNGHIPFTPRAKKVLELGLREALALHHHYIGTEHLLLGLIREGDGVGAEILSARAGDPLALRMSVLDLVPAGTPGLESRLRPRRPRLFGGRLAEPEPTEDIRTTAAAEVSLDEAARLAGGSPVGSHHLLLAALGDPNTAAAQVLARLGVDLEQAREALRDADVAGTSDEQPEEAGRRTMLLRVAENRLTIEITDRTLVDAARAALEALEDPGAEVIRGDLPVSVSLGAVWQATYDGLGDIRRRAAAGALRPAPDVTEHGTD